MRLNYFSSKGRSGNAGGLLQSHKQPTLRGFFVCMVKYSDVLKMPEWQKKRLEVFQRDNFKCCNCNSTTRQLEVHHVDYVKDWKPWKYPMDMLVTLCRECHEKEQARPRYETTLLRSMRFKGFTADDMLRLSVAIELSPEFVTKIKNAISKL